MREIKEGIWCLATSTASSANMLSLEKGSAPQERKTSKTLLLLSLFPLKWLSCFATQKSNIPNWNLLVCSLFLCGSCSLYITKLTVCCLFYNVNMSQEWKKPQNKALFFNELIPTSLIFSNSLQVFIPHRLHVGIVCCFPQQSWSLEPTSSVSRCTWPTESRCWFSL